MRKRAARGPRPRLRGLLAHACVAVLCLFSLSAAVLDKDEADQLYALLNATQPDQDPSISDPCSGDIPRMRKRGLFIACTVSSSSQESVHITSMELFGNSFTGSMDDLTKLNFTQMNRLSVERTRLQGGLPAMLQGPSLQQLNFIDNRLMAGEIPEAWGGDVRFPNLYEMKLGPSWWQGELPRSWGYNESFPRLEVLEIRGPDNEVGPGRLTGLSRGLTGPIPTSWDGPGSFPALRELDLSQNSLSGRVPSRMLGAMERSGQDAPFPNLRSVSLFRQWGSNLCAHLSIADDVSFFQSWEWKAKLEDIPEDPEDLKDYGDAPSPAGNSHTLFSGCQAMDVGLRSSALAQIAASYLQSGPSSLEEPPVFCLPSVAQSNSAEVGRNIEVFIGRCDMPEALLLMQSLHLDTIPEDETVESLNYCTWPGVACDPDARLSIKSLELNSCKSSGTKSDDDPVKTRFVEKQMGFLPHLVRKGALHKLESVEIMCGLWGPIPQSWMQLTSLKNFTLVGNNFFHVLPEEFDHPSRLQHFKVTTNERIGCLPLSLGVSVAPGGRSLKTLQILESNAGSTYDALQPSGPDCPVPTHVTRGQRDGSVQGDWGVSDGRFEAIRNLTSLNIPATAALLNLSEFDCAPTRTICPVDIPAEPCNLSWQTLQLPAGHACGTAYLPAALGCQSACVAQAPMECTETCEAPSEGAVCQRPSDCKSGFRDDLRCSAMYLRFVLLPAPGGAVNMPAGPYASALSAAIAVGAAVAAEASSDEPYMVGRAGVSGVFMWDAANGTLCEDLRNENSSVIAEELQQHMIGPAQSDAGDLSLMLASSLRCPDPRIPARRAVEVLPWMLATHLNVSMYVVSPQGPLSGTGSSVLGCPAAFAGRRLQQVAGPADQDMLANRALEVALTSDRQAVEATMAASLEQMQLYTGLDAVALANLQLLPDLGTGDEQPQGGVHRRLVVAGSLCAAALLVLGLIAAYCLRRQRRPPQTALAYVENTQAAQPMLPAEGREQLKGLLYWLKRKRSEDALHAMSRPIGHPVEPDPEPSVRMKMEHIVKALLCASAPGHPMETDFIQDTSPRHPFVVPANALMFPRRSDPKFSSDEGTLLSNLVLKGRDVNMPAAARLSSAKDTLFSDDPFGIYCTVQFQTNLWEMLLSYREEERKPWEPALPSRRFSCVGTLDFEDRFDEFRELQKRRMAVVMMRHAQPSASTLGKLPRAASSGIPRSTSSLPQGALLANIDEEDGSGESQSTDAAAAGSLVSATSGLAGAHMAHMAHAATAPAGHVPSASLGSGSLIGNRAVSVVHVPGKAIFDEQSGPITEEKLETRRDHYKSVLSLDEGSLTGQSSFPHPNSAQAGHTPTGSQGACAPFDSLGSPGAEGVSTLEGADMSPNAPAAMKLSAFQCSVEPAGQRQGVQKARAAEVCISRSFSWPYCQSLADMDFQAPQRNEDGMINTSAWPDSNAAFFLSTDARHPMAFLGSVMFLGKRQKARLAGCVTAPFKPPDKLHGSRLQNRPPEGVTKPGVLKPVANAAMQETADVSKLAQQVATEWRLTREESTPATTNSDAPLSDTVPFLPPIPGTSARPPTSDSGPMASQMLNIYANVNPNSVRVQRDNVYMPPAGLYDSGAPAQQGADGQLQPGPEASQLGSGAGPGQADGGVWSSRLLVGQPAPSHAPASPIHKGYIQLGELVRNLSGMQTGGNMPQSPMAPGVRQTAITPPDLVSTTGGDGHSENGMLAAFTILKDCFQMIYKQPSNMDNILQRAIGDIQSVVSQQFNNERQETDIDLVGITGSIDMTTEPVQDPEVPDFDGGRRDDRGLGLGGLPPVSSGFQRDPSLDQREAEPSSQTAAPPMPAPRVSPGLVDEDAAIDPSKLMYDSLLGRGAFGEVHYGRWEAPDGIIHEVAIKVLLATRYGSLREHEQERGKFFKEMRLMMRMRHHSIVRCFGGAQARQEGDRDVMVLEYIPGGTLDHYVHEHRRDNRLSLNEVLVIATDLADVLRYLHRNGIVHQDLKPSNILLNEKGEVKLTDFGISKIKRSTYLSRFMVGTPSYTAPEVWRADAVNEKCDMFALGILLWECMTGTRPFKNMHAFQIMMHLQNTSRQNSSDWLPFPSRTPDDFKLLVRRCWHAENRERISAEEALASAVLLRTRIPESQLNEPVPLDQQSSRSRDPMMLPRGDSRSIQLGNAVNAAAASHRPPIAPPPMPPGDPRSSSGGVRDSAASIGNRYMPSSPRQSCDTGSGDAPTAGAQTGGGSTGPSAATWSSDFRAPTMRPTGFGGFGDSTQSAFIPGASNSGSTSGRQGGSSTSATQPTSRSAALRHPKPPSSSGNSTRAGGRLASRAPNPLSVVPERSHGHQSASASLTLPGVSNGGVMRASARTARTPESGEFTFDEQATLDVTTDIQAQKGGEEGQATQHLAQSDAHVLPSTQGTAEHSKTVRRSNGYLPLLPSTQAEMMQDVQIPNQQAHTPAAYSQAANSPVRNANRGMSPSIAVAAPGDGFYGAKFPWVQTNDTSVTVTLAPSDALEDRPSPGQHGLALHEAWSMIKAKT